MGLAGVLGESGSPFKAGGPLRWGGGHTGQTGPPPGGPLHTGDVTVRLWRLREGLPYTEGLKNAGLRTQHGLPSVREMGGDMRVVKPGWLRDHGKTCPRTDSGVLVTHLSSLLVPLISFIKRHRFSTSRPPVVTSLIFLPWSLKFGNRYISCSHARDVLS